MSNDHGPNKFQLPKLKVRGAQDLRPGLRQIAAVVLEGGAECRKRVGFFAAICAYLRVFGKIILFSRMMKVSNARLKTLGVNLGADPDRKLHRAG